MHNLPKVPSSTSQDALEAQFNLPLAADENTVPYISTDKRPTGETCEVRLPRNQAKITRDYDGNRMH